MGRISTDLKCAKPPCSSTQARTSIRRHGSSATRQRTRACHRGGRAAASRRYSSTASYGCEGPCDAPPAGNAGAFGLLSLGRVEKGGSRQPDVPGVATLHTASGSWCMMISTIPAQTEMHPKPIKLINHYLILGPRDPFLLEGSDGNIKPKRLQLGSGPRAQATKGGTGANQPGRMATFLLQSTSGGERTCGRCIHRRVGDGKRLLAAQSDGAAPPALHGCQLHRDQRRHRWHGVDIGCVSSGPRRHWAPTRSRLYRICYQRSSFHR